MKDIFFALSALLSVAALFIFLSGRSKPRPKSSATAISSLASPHDDPAHSAVRYDGDCHWTVELVPRPDWFDTGIPAASNYLVWIEAEGTACDFIMKLFGQIYSTEEITEPDLPKVRKIHRFLAWSQTPKEELSRVDTIKLRVDGPCQQQALTLNIESSAQPAPDQALLDGEEHSEDRQKILAGHRIAEELRRLFEPLPEK